MSSILTFRCFSLSPEWYGVDVWSHCDAERVCGTFSSPIYKLQLKMSAYFTFESHALPNICKAQNVLSPNLNPVIYQIETFSTCKDGHTDISQPWYAHEHLHANEQTALIFKQLQYTRAINTHPLSYPVAHSRPHYHIRLMQTEHLFMHLCIRDVRHVGFDCTEGSFGDVAVSL